MNPALAKGATAFSIWPGRDALEAAVDGNHPHRAIERPAQSAQRADQGQHQRRRAARSGASRDSTAGHCQRRFCGLASTLEAIAAQHPAHHLRVLEKLVSSTRHTNSSKSMPAWRAAIGTRLWSVMPGRGVDLDEKELARWRARA